MTVDLLHVRSLTWPAMVARRQTRASLNAIAPSSLPTRGRGGQLLERRT